MCSTLQGKDNAISESKGIMALLSPIYLAVIPVFMTDANESF